MRIVSEEFKREVNASQTAEKFIPLLIIEEDTLSEPLRLCQNDIDIISNGEIFYAAAFDITLPDDAEGQLPTSKITLDNVTREIGLAVRGMQKPPSFTIQVIRVSAPDFIEATFTGFHLKQININKQTITGSLTVNNFYNQKYPKDSFIPSLFPGLF